MLLWLLCKISWKSLFVISMAQRMNALHKFNLKLGHTFILKCLLF